MGIDLHIDELVLHGFGQRDRRRIAESVQLELARLIAADGQARFLNKPLALERIDGGAFKVQANVKPQLAGWQIAQNIFRSLQQHAGASGGSAASSRASDRQGGRQP
jgi:hypothetical protein